MKLKVDRNPNLVLRVEGFDRKLNKMFLEWTRNLEDGRAGKIVLKTGRSRKKGSELMFVFG
jgi:hypothetical protein